MKKMKLIIVLFLITIVIVVIYNVNQLRHIKISKTIIVNTSISQVFNLVAEQNNFYKWSPFFAKDKSLKYEVKNDENLLGSQLHWSGGADNKDLGYQEVTLAHSPREVVIKCYVQKPFEAQSTFSYELKEEDGKVVLTQNFEMDSNFVNALFMWFTRAKKGIESTNEFGLELLRQEAENS